MNSHGTISVASDAVLGSFLSDPTESFAQDRQIDIQVGDIGWCADG